MEQKTLRNSEIPRTVKSTSHYNAPFHSYHTKQMLNGLFSTFPFSPTCSNFPLSSFSLTASLSFTHHRNRNSAFSHQPLHPKMQLLSYFHQTYCITLHPTSETALFINHLSPSYIYFVPLASNTSLTQHLFMLPSFQPQEFFFTLISFHCLGYNFSFFFSIKEKRMSNSLATIILEKITQNPLSCQPSNLYSRPVITTHSQSVLYASLCAM